MTLRGLTVALGLFAVLAAAGCTSSSKPAAPSPSVATPDPGSPNTAAVRPAALAATIRTGLAGVRTVHLTLSTTVGTQKLAGFGDLALAAGKLSKADVTQALPGGLGAIRVIVTGGKEYAKLPSALTGSGKPWVMLAGDNANPVIAQFSQLLDPILAITSPATVADIVASATDARHAGPNGYVLDPDGTAVPALGTVTLAPKEAVYLTLGEDGRPARVRGTLVVAGQRLEPTVSFEQYNARVAIAAPPAGQISTK